jgi:hypothetical protein
MDTRELLLARLRQPLRLWLARTSLAAIGTYVVALLALHVAAFPLEPVHMSEFALSPLGWLWTGAGALLALACLVVAWAAAPVLPRDIRSIPGVLLLGFAAVALLVVAVIPMDRADAAMPGHLSLAGRLHNDAAWGTFLALSAAMLLLAGAFRSNPLWSSLAAPTLWLGLAAFLSSLAYIGLEASRSGAAGLLQRAVVGIGLAWLALLALRLQELGALAIRLAAAQRT